MQTDQLRRALDDLAGDDPEVDAAFANVTGRARKQRNHFRLGLVAALVVIVVGGASLSAAHFGTNEHKLSVVHSSPGVGDINDLTWTRVAAPVPFHTTRIVAVRDKTLLIGTGIRTINATGVSTETVDPTEPINPPRMNVMSDLIEARGALIAVGEQDSDIWRLPDGTTQWERATVELPSGVEAVSMTRVIDSNGVIYAVGTAAYPASANLRPGTENCPIYVWTSIDGSNFHLSSESPECAGQLAAAAGPAGVVIATSDNATAWTQSGDEWSPHLISSETHAYVQAISGDEHGYVAVGHVLKNSNNVSGAIWWSPDGRTWTRVLTAAAPGSTFHRATFAAVTHTATGWAAVGSAVRVGDDLALTDAILWTSTDGRHWTPDSRDSGVFEQYADAFGVGPTTDGIAIWGTANVTVDEATGLMHQDNVVWLGSRSRATTGLGTIAGTLRMVGGPPKAPDTYVPGTIIATATDGHEVTATVGADGHFSAQLAAGSYRVVGHSPLYQDGTSACTMAGRAIVKPNELTHVELMCQRD